MAADLQKPQTLNPVKLKCIWYIVHSARFLCTVLMYWLHTVVGVVAMWQLLFEDIIQYRGQDSAQARNVAKEIHMKCCEASRVFFIYSMLFVLGLPEFGLNTFTLLRLLAGPSLFHFVIAFIYSRFKESCLKQPEQQQQHVSPGAWLMDGW